MYAAVPEPMWCERECTVVIECGSDSFALCSFLARLGDGAVPLRVVRVRDCHQTKVFFGQGWLRPNLAPQLFI